MYTLEGTILIQSSRNFIRMLMIIISRSGSKLGHVWSKSGSPGQIIEIPCVHPETHSFDPKFMKLCQNVNNILSRPGWKLGHVGSKTRSLGQILEKPCVHSKRHSFDPKFMKLCQIVSHHNI